MVFHRRTRERWPLLLGAGLRFYRRFRRTCLACSADRVKRRPPESGITNRLGRSLEELFDTWRVPNEEMTGIVFVCWLGCSLDTENGLGPMSLKAGTIAALNATTTRFRKFQQQLGKLVNHGRHAAHAAHAVAQDQLSQDGTGHRFRR